MRIVCQQTILMKYALFVIFEKNGKILNCRLLQNIGGALRAELQKWPTHLTWRLDNNLLTAAGSNLCFTDPEGKTIY